MTAAPTTERNIGCDAAWSRSVGDVLEAFRVDPGRGLDGVEARRRLKRHGPNQLTAIKRRNVFSILVDQFRSVVILLLVAAGALAMLVAEPVEGLAIFAVIAINAAIGFVTEWRAIRSMEALSLLGRVDTIVIREGVVHRIPADEVVPGELVVFEGGDIVTADIRLIEAAKLQADESTLTGESLPVGKQTEPLGDDTPVMERSNMVFKGTAITRGSGKGVVVATGLDTELGRISELVKEAAPQQTPLEKRLDALGGRLIWVVLALALLLAGGGILVGRDTFLAIEVAIALAVAAIPEGLPIVATIALARGMWRMARRNALVSRLSAVETLGATSVILTDKTGTLTENRMTVTRVQVPGADIIMARPGQEMAGRFRERGGEPAGESAARLDELLTVAALCSNASLHESGDGETQAVGDPTEVALLAAAALRSIRREQLLERLPEISEVSFDPDTKLMATLHRDGDGVLIAVKGAPEAVLPLCIAERTAEGDRSLAEDRRRRWLEDADALGRRGLRTLAVAVKTAADPGENPYADLALLGIVGIEDPARYGVKDAIDRCRDAGISIVMVTGDHAATARNIATELGMVDGGADGDRFASGGELDRLIESPGDGALLDVQVISRATPEQKLDLINFYQQQGQVVAMTGDGVNDAPALKKADIGVAMGLRGTAVAREAAAMVLQDDEFSTIVEAVAQGRAIYENIRKFVVYLLSCNISEVLVVSLATVAGAPLPLLPLQILFLNLVTDVFPALALGVGEGAPGLMKQRPRPADEPVLTERHWLRIALHGAVISAAVLGAMALAFFYLGFDTERAVTVSFCTLALAQLWHVFNMRDDIGAVFSNEVTKNPWIWLAIVLCLGLIAAAVYNPLLSELLVLRDPGAAGWLVVLVMSLTPLVAAPLVRTASRRVGVAQR